MIKAMPGQHHGAIGPRDIARLRNLIVMIDRGMDEAARQMAESVESPQGRELSRYLLGSDGSAEPTTEWQEFGNALRAATLT